MGWATWWRAVRHYWKEEAYLNLVALSQKILGIRLTQEFSLFFWWICFVAAIIALSVNGTVLIIEDARVLVSTPVDRETPGAVCLCNSMVPNKEILQIFPNQTAFDGLDPILNSSLALSEVWNSGSTFIGSWTAPLNWTLLLKQVQEEFQNQLLTMQVAIQLTLVLFANGTRQDNAFSQIVKLEINSYANSFLYIPEPESPICPTASCVISTYPSGWSLFIKFLIIVISSNVIIWLVMFCISSVIWNINKFRTPKDAESL